MFLGLTFDPFVGTKSHTLTQAGDDERITNSQESKVLAEGQILGMKEDDWLVCEGGEARVDTSDDISNATSEFV